MGAPDIPRLLDPAVWNGHIHDSGQWRTPRGGRREVVEPATGGVLWTTGIADAADMDEAIGRAQTAQPPLGVLDVGAGELRVPPGQPPVQRQLALGRHDA